MQCPIWRKDRTARHSLVAGLAFAAMALLGTGEGRASTDRTLADAAGLSITQASLIAFPRWADVLSRMARMKDAPPCATATFGACPFREFQEALFRVRPRTPMEQLVAVQRLVNAVPYVIDTVNYQREDYWATPRQFFYRGGDCEDYAIAKMWALEQLGFPSEALHLVILRDVARSLDHAVLRVELDGNDYILDNERSAIAGPSALRRYKQIYSVSPRRP